jgi:pyruvate formate lyase activating enzyme
VINEIEAEPKPIEVWVDGVRLEAPSGVTVAEALRRLGYRFKEPGSGEPSLACETGGCWSCALLIDGELERSCITPIREGVRIETSVEGMSPLRIIHGPEPHPVGGKATPWWETNGVHYVEAAIWAAGCDLRCPQCQNYHVTYDNYSAALTPLEAAKEVAYCSKRYGTRGAAISGGEPTLNRGWLLEFFRELTRLVGGDVRRHLDSNGTLLTADYVDALVEAGCNNIGVEPKAVEVETYMGITGLKDRERASRYLENAWRAVEYIDGEYRGEVYLGVGLIYNRRLIALEEIAEAGSRIAAINPELQVTVLDYYPTFRRRDIERPTVREMKRVKETLEGQGLRCVIVQTAIGHIGPDKGRGRSAWRNRLRDIFKRIRES